MNPEDPSPDVIEYAPVKKAKWSPVKTYLAIALPLLVLAALLVRWIYSKMVSISRTTTGLETYLEAIGCIVLVCFLWWIIGMALRKFQARSSNPGTQTETKKSGWRTFGRVIIWIVALGIFFFVIIPWMMQEWRSQTTRQPVAQSTQKNGVNYNVLTTPVPMPSLSSPAPKAQESEDVAALAPTPAIPQATLPPSDRHAYHVGKDGVMAPVLLSKIEPTYTEEARRAHFSGTVTVNLVVDENGDPTDLDIVDLPGFSLEEPILIAIRQWRWRPGTRDGVPVPVYARVTTQFRR